MIAQWMKSLKIIKKQYILILKINYYQTTCIHLIIFNKMVAVNHLFHLRILMKQKKKN
jgi:hypothetical protein